MKKIYYIYPYQSASWTPADLPNIIHWYRSTVGVTIDGASGRATRVNDQIGTIDWLDNVTGFTVFNPDPAVPNGSRSLAGPTNGPVSVNRALADAAAGWVTSHPFTLLFIAKLSYTSGAPSELITPVGGGFGSGITMFRQSNFAGGGANANEWRAATSGNLLLNGAGQNNINWNSTTNANLTIGQTTPYQIVGLRSTTGSNGLNFARNGTVLVQSTPTSPRVYGGGQLRFGASSPAITWLDIIVMNATMSASDYTNLKSWLNSEYGFGFV